MWMLAGRLGVERNGAMRTEAALESVGVQGAIVDDRFESKIWLFSSDGARDEFYKIWM